MFELFAVITPNWWWYDYYCYYNFNSGCYYSSSDFRVGLVGSSAVILFSLDDAMKLCLLVCVALPLTISVAHASQGALLTQKA